MTTQNTQSTSAKDVAVVAVFDNHEFVEAAVKQLASSHFDITKVTVMGRGFHSEEDVSGFYNAGDRIKIWGKYGALWGGIWGFFLGGLSLTIPVIGPVVAVGHFATIIVAVVEGAIAIGGLSVLGAALYSIGIPKDSVIRYEKAIKADGFLLVVHGTTSEVERARALLQTNHPTQLDIHEGIDMNPAAMNTYQNRPLIAAN